MQSSSSLFSTCVGVNHVGVGVDVIVHHDHRVGVDVVVVAAVDEDVF